MATSNNSDDAAVAAVQQGDNLVKNSTALSIVSLVSVATSFMWDVAIATKFGISARSDAFYFAYTLPSILTSLVFLAAYSILVPAVSRRLGSGEQESAWRLFSIVANVVLVATVFVGIIGAVTSYALVAVLAPGFGAQTSDVAAQMSVILFLSLGAAVGFEVLRTGLYSANRLVVPTTLSVLGNLIIVGFIVVGGSQFGVRSAALGVAAAKITQFAIIAVLLSRVPGFRYHLSLRIKEPHVMETLRAFISPMSGMGARRIVLVFERLIASTLPAGSLTALSLGNRLGTVVGTVYYDSVTTALLPALSVQIWQRRWASVRENLLVGIRLVSFISLPAVIVLVMLRVPVVGLMFEHGLVTKRSVGLTASILAIYSLSLLPMGHFRVLQNYFYAAERRGLIMVLFGFAAVTNLLLDLALVYVWGAKGIAAAFAVSSVLVMVVGYVLMWPRVGGWPVRELAGFAARSALAGALCAGTVAVIQAAWPGSSNLQDTLSRAEFVTTAGGTGALVYFVVSFIAQPEDAKRFISLLGRRLRRRGTRPHAATSIQEAAGSTNGFVGADVFSTNELVPPTKQANVASNHSNDLLPVFRPSRRVIYEEPWSGANSDASVALLSDAGTPGGG